jgi:hypothetical protein
VKETTVLTQRLELAKNEVTLVLAELLLLNDAARTSAEKETVARLMSRMEKIGREIEDADTLARGAAMVSRKAGVEAARLLAPEPKAAGAVSGEQATPSAPTVGECNGVNGHVAANGHHTVAFGSGVSAVLLSRLVKAMESIDGAAA